MNIYYNPEQFGLKTVGQVDFATPGSGFDLLVVWQDEATGQLFYAEDRGCSCPEPFAGQSRATIITVTAWNLAYKIENRLLAADAESKIVAESTVYALLKRIVDISQETSSANSKKGN